MSRFFLNDEHGAVTTDWVALAAGVLLLAIFVVFSVMENSAGYLLDEFEQLNNDYEARALEVSSLDDQTDTKQ
ncbi:MAG: hypothetical protein ACTSVG_13670 [Alphaproteobacteria bacterium]